MDRQASLMDLPGTHRIEEEAKTKAGTERKELTFRRKEGDNGRQHTRKKNKIK